MQVRPKVLFISSWYPTVLKPTEGNFVQQHILAAQQIADVALVHVVLSPTHQTITHEAIAAPYEAHLVYIPKSEVFFFGLVLNYFKIFSTYWKFVGQTKLAKPDLIHANVLFPIGLVGLLLKLRWRIPLLFTEHWTCYHEAADPQPTRFQKFFLRWIGKKANLIMPVSLDLAAAMQRFGINAPMKVVPNVVDPLVFTPVEKRPHGVYRFVHISSLDPEQKNFHLLLRAFHQLKKQQAKVELHVISDGDYNAYAKLIKGFEFANSIHFHGRQDSAGVAAMLQFADALVLSSRFENLPCVLLEALSTGTPMISTQVGGVAELINDSNGILVASEDEQALLAAMIEIQQRQYVAQELHQVALQKYSPTAIAGLFLEAYQSVLNKDVA
ncbi:MAG: glycosyltransferase [Crocinitomicaceae bacterium]|nr:glycosyltransferase [Crocinitomicaceae bacterium]MDP4799006.1 glycosyltransferase [Crocinitomicaceae bacterium]